MSQEHKLEIDQAVNIVDNCADIIFEHAPVMLIAMNEEGTIVKVNEQWLATMGYESKEVLGHKATECMTEESGAQAVTDAHPLFWEVGKAHSIGCEMVRKDGRVFDVLLDAYVIEQPLGERFGLASLWERGPDSKRVVASTVVRTYMGLVQASQILCGLLASTATDEPVDQATGTQPSELASQARPEADDWDLLSHIAHDVSSDMQTLAEEEEARIHSLSNQRQQLLLLAETVENTLAKVTMGAE